MPAKSDPCTQTHPHAPFAQIIEKIPSNCAFLLWSWFETDKI